MYISSTNLYIKSSDYSSNIPASLISSEKYYNCEYFFTAMNHKKSNLLQKLKQIFN